MFCDKKVNLISVLAATAWTVGGGMVVLGLVTRTLGLPAIGLWISGWGGVLTVKRGFEASAGREHEAFEMGRTIGATQAKGDLRSL